MFIYYSEFSMRCFSLDHVKSLHVAVHQFCRVFHPSHSTSSQIENYQSFGRGVLQPKFMIFLRLLRQHQFHLHPKTIISHLNQAYLMSDKKIFLFLRYINLKEQYYGNPKLKLNYFSYNNFCLSCNMI